MKTYFLFLAYFHSKNVIRLINLNHPIPAHSLFVKSHKHLWDLVFLRELTFLSGSKLTSKNVFIWVFFHLRVARAWMKNEKWVSARSVLNKIKKEDIQNKLQIRTYDFLMGSIKKKERLEWRRLEKWVYLRIDSSPEPQPWRHAMNFLMDIRFFVPDVSPPILEDGEDGPSLTWSRPGVYVTVEILGPNQSNWFARDRVRNFRDGVDDPVPWRDKTLLKWIKKTNES